MEGLQTGGYRGRVFRQVDIEGGSTYRSLTSGNPITVSSLVSSSSRKFVISSVFNNFILKLNMFLRDI